MFPVIARFKTPEFLTGFLPAYLTINSYGFCIALGIVVAFFIIIHRTKKLGLNQDNLSELFLWCFAAAFIGGKLFYYFESPSKYLASPSLMLQNMGNGFVFYGSLIFVIPTMYWWLRKNKIPFWPFMDGVAFGGPVLHSFGRLGCFLVGCCHGKVCDNALGVVFSHPLTSADPKNTPLYPTQLFDIFINLSILLIVYFVSKKQQFKGQLFLIYIMLYAIGRAINETFRGDDERGFLFGGIITYSQFIALVLFILASASWYYLLKKGARSANLEENKSDNSDNSINP